MLQLKRSGTLKFFILFPLIAGVAIRAMAEEDRRMTVSSQTATFAAGCFWGVEKVFSEQKGVLSTQVGYTGGGTQTPGYEEVCTGETGHAEAIEIVFDPAILSYEKLLETFFSHHDPTTLNRQGPDIGTQYRSAIFTHNDSQRKAALKAKDLLDRSGIFKRPVATEISPAGPFYRAEEYHQKYLKKNPHGYCSLQLQSNKIQEVLEKGMKDQKSGTAEK